MIWLFECFFFLSRKTISKINYLGREMVAGNFINYFNIAIFALLIVLWIIPPLPRPR